MGSCRDMSSSLYRYVSFCVDSAESPTPETTALTATEESSHRNHQPAASGSVPLLSPPDTSGGETNATFSHQHSQPTFTKSTHCHHSQLNPDSSSALPNIDKAPNADGGEEGRRGIKEDPSLLHPKDKSFLLPRSSPVISRSHRPVSWHGRGADSSAQSSLDSRSPASDWLVLDQPWRLTVTSMEDVRSKPTSCHQPFPQEEKKLRCISASSHLNCPNSTGLHLPFSGQQGFAAEHRGRGLHSSGFYTSTQHSKDRSCSGFPQFSADIFKTSCELEKENAHFIVVDLVLEVMEAVKWTLSCDRWTDTHQITAENNAPHEQRCEACRHTQTSYRNTHSSYEHTQDEEEAEHPPKTFSVLSTDSGFEDCGFDIRPTPRDSLTNAAPLAQQLVLEFRKSWFPSHEPRRGQQSLRSCLQELPGTRGMVVSSGSLAEEIRLRTRMRGSLSWAPPRFQIIFTVQPTHRRSEVVALQHFLCAGCGTQLESRHIKKLRYCEYLGRYFCDCCHGGSEAVIPGRLLSCWDFSRYPVSDFSKQLLDSVWHQPLFDLSCVGKTLYSRVKELHKFRELQEQLIGIRKFLSTCRLSGRVTPQFEQLPAHLTEQPHLFSMDDLLRLKKGQLVVQARALLHAAVAHVENCEVCLARGFICEFCRERDVIFPFQSDICRRCPECRACFHKHCFVEKKCPKCARIHSRRKRPDGSMK